MRKEIDQYWGFCISKCSLWSLLISICNKLFPVKKVVIIKDFNNFDISYLTSEWVRGLQGWPREEATQETRLANIYDSKILWKGNCTSCWSLAVASIYKFEDNSLQTSAQEWPTKRYFIGTKAKGESFTLAYCPKNVPDLNIYMRRSETYPITVSATYCGLRVLHN